MSKSFVISVSALVLIFTGCATNVLTEQPFSSSVTSSQTQPSKSTIKKQTDDFEQNALDDIPQGTDIVIRSGKDRTIHEYRINGFLYSIKIIPKVGKPYYLVAVNMTGGFARSNRPQMLIPSWKILEWQ